VRVPLAAFIIGSRIKGRLDLKGGARAAAAELSSRSNGGTETGKPSPPLRAVAEPSKSYLVYKREFQMLGDMLMQDPNQLREQARRCRVLAKTAIEPEVIEQLRVWSVELADEADAAERRAAAENQGPDVW
jgi:hypothetical protein